VSLSRRDALIAGAASVPLSGLWSAVAAQDARPAGQPGGAGQPGAAAAGKDPLLAACLLIGGRKQIEKCEFSLTKLRMEETKAFAKAEIDEHVTIKNRLKELGFELPADAPRPGGAPGGGGAQPVPPAAGQPGAAGQPVPPGRPAGMMMIGKFPLPPGAAELLAVDLEVAQQCVANYRKEMEEKEKKGELKVEKGFVGDQLHEHFGLLDRAQVFQRHASKDMQKVLAEGQGIIEKHIATLKAIMEKLDGMQDRK
jgi:uncharacterized coiled-coil protein SlyX